ncbi:hypothetical protein [Marinicellulosiphila megalodicopiae]|uniref:hypothetical protein n=1 Tax=Marinicellulosiphila megalodicopiae TaxID=2724896 RepID=UPI003BB17BB8
MTDSAAATIKSSLIKMALGTTLSAFFILLALMMLFSKQMDFFITTIVVLIGLVGILFAVFAFSQFAKVTLSFAKNEKKHVTNALTQAKDMLDNSKTLKEEQVYYRSLIDSMPMQAWVLNAQYQYAVINRLHQQALNLAEKEILGQFEDEQSYELTKQCLETMQQVHSKEFDETQRKTFETIRYPIEGKGQTKNAVVCFRYLITDDSAKIQKH